MDGPPLGQEVVVTLAEGGTCLAYWDGEQWMIGVENDPTDAPLEREVVSWHWRED